MATSPIYGWLEPDNTDLVKNGALAIRTLGNAIDTTMATMTPKSLVDAKGDLIAASANDTPARLAVGNNGETLVADSSTTTGLRYTAGTVQANPVLNSAFQIWQRGTSIAQAAANTYSADRWVSARNGFDVGTTMSRQLTGDTTNLPFIQYCGRVQRNSGTTATTGVFFSQSIESINSIPFMGKTITFSFYARAGANYSSASNALAVLVQTGTGTDQNVLSTWTGASSAIGGQQNATLTTTWQRFTYTGTASATGNQLGFYFSYTPVGTAGANDWFEVTGVQIDIGSVALPFRTYAATIQGELSACQRYYYRNASGRAYGHIAFGMAYLTTGASFNVVLPVTMRATPSSIEFANLQVNQPGTGGSTVTSLTYSQIESSFNFANVAATGLSGLTQYRPYYLINDNNINGYFAASAEL
jgi:hypothetical protein